MSTRPIIVPIVVESCTSCPFVKDSDGDSEFDWTCHATYDDRGWPLGLGRTPPATPPPWCPLRMQARLVQLKEGI